jgi:hypothetical protein
MPTLKQIKSAYNKGYKVYWENTNYEVRKWTNGWVILSKTNQHAVGLVSKSGELSANPSSFRISKVKRKKNMKKYKYKGKVITIKTENTIIGNIYRSYIGSKRAGVSFSKQNVIEDAKKYIRKKLK